jgi:hypothetical protein
MLRIAKKLILQITSKNGVTITQKFLLISSQHVSAEIDHHRVILEELH